MSNGLTLPATPLYVTKHGARPVYSTLLACGHGGGAVEVSRHSRRLPKRRLCRLCGGQRAIVAFGGTAELSQEPEPTPVPNDPAKGEPE